VTGAIADKILPDRARAWEAESWAGRGATEGWFKVTPETLVSGALKAEVPNATTPQRTLLFIHGTFSDAASAFISLAATDFFRQVQPVYGDRIYAFNHFTVSK